MTPGGIAMVEMEDVAMGMVCAATLAAKHPQRSAQNFNGGNFKEGISLWKSPDGGIFLRRGKSLWEPVQILGACHAFQPSLEAQLRRRAPHTKTFSSDRAQREGRGPALALGFENGADVVRASGFVSERERAILGHLMSGAQKRA